MSTTSTCHTTFTLFFNGQFWVGVLEHDDGGGVRAAQAVFGAEPSDAALYAWMLAHGSDLANRARRAPRIPEERTGRARRGVRVSPKRAVRLAAKAAAQHRPSTAAQEAVAAEREARAAEASSCRRANRDAEARRRRALARQKAKARHRGH